MTTEKPEWLKYRFKEIYELCKGDENKAIYMMPDRLWYMGYAHYYWIEDDERMKNAINFAKKTLLKEE